MGRGRKLGSGIMPVLEPLTLAPAAWPLLQARPPHPPQPPSRVLPGGGPVETQSQHFSFPFFPVAVQEVKSVCADRLSSPWAGRSDLSHILCTGCVCGGVGAQLCFSNQARLSDGLQPVTAVLQCSGQEDRLWGQTAWVQISTLLLTV